MLKIEHRTRDSIDHVTLDGRLGAADGPDAATEIIGIFERGTGTLHLEMSAVEWIDSGGLSALVTILKRVRKYEGELVLLNVNERVRALLELTRLHEIFDLREDRGDDQSQKVA